jgi:hypothetical protein
MSTNTSHSKTAVVSGSGCATDLETAIETSMSSLKYKIDIFQHPDGLWHSVLYTHSPQGSDMLGFGCGDTCTQAIADLSIHFGESLNTEK